MIFFQFSINPNEKRLNKENLKMHDKLYLREAHCEPNDHKYKYTKEKEEHNLVWIQNVNTCYAQYQMEMIQTLTQPDLHEFPKSDLKELKTNPPARYIKSDKVFKNGPNKICGGLYFINFTLPFLEYFGPNILYFIILCPKHNILYFTILRPKHYPV